MERTEPYYRLQAKVIVPVRFGWALPLAFQYANRTAAGTRADVKFQFGFTFDLAKAISDYAIEGSRNSQ
jgi:hypothetical protein